MQPRTHRKKLGSPMFTVSMLAVMALMVVACGDTSGSTAQQQPEGQAEGSADETASQDVNLAGETIRVVVPFGEGGTFDTLARIVADYFSTNLPGQPTVFVDNLTGGGGLVGVSEVYNAEPDGLTLGHWTSTFSLLQALELEEGLAFEDFEVLGVTGGTYHALVTHSRVDLDMLTGGSEEVRFAGTGVGGSLSDSARMAKAIAGLDAVTVVDGYDGQGDLYLAMQQDEVHGAAGLVYDYETNAVLREMLDDGDAHYVLAVGGEELSEDFASLLEGIPTLEEYVDDEQEQQLYDAYTDMLRTFRVFVTTPGTPEPLVEAYRDVMATMVEDEEFISAVEDAGMFVNPTIGEEAEEAFRGILTLDSETQERLQSALLPE